jgi:hypothetical protein
MHSSTSAEFVQFKLCGPYSTRISDLSLGY